MANKPTMPAGSGRRVTPGADFSALKPGGFFKISVKGLTKEQQKKERVRYTWRAQYWQAKLSVLFRVALVRDYVEVWRRP